MYADLGDAHFDLVLAVEVRDAVCRLAEPAEVKTRCTPAAASAAEMPCRVSACVPPSNDVVIAKRGGRSFERLRERVLFLGLSPVSAMTEDLQSRRIGINGVPFFVLNGRFGLSGAQEPEAPLMILDLAREEDMQKGVA